MTGKIWMESRVPEAVREKLLRRGRERGVREEFDLWFGGAQGVLIDRRTGKIQGAADPRREGAVLGY